MLGMVQAFRRGGQTTLSLEPALDARLRGCGQPRAFAEIAALLERIRGLAPFSRTSMGDVRLQSCWFHCGASMQ